GLRLGAQSDSDDADGVISALAVEQPPSLAQVEQTVREFVGSIDQVPPAFSAAHVTGRRAYELARKGRKPPLQPRRVVIDRIQVLTYEYPQLEFLVHCGKGTYIRSL